MATTDEQKKAILPFLQVRHADTDTATGLPSRLLDSHHCTLQRADEIGKVEPKVAYYCRLYAIQQVPKVITSLDQSLGLLGQAVIKAGFRMEAASCRGLLLRPEAPR